MTATNHDKSPRLQLSGRDIAGACLAACGLLLIIWGGTLESVTVTDPGFMSFAVSGLVTIAVGACLAPAVPRTARVALIWLATLTSMLYLFIIDMAVIVSLMSCVQGAKILRSSRVSNGRCDKTAGSTR